MRADLWHIYKLTVVKKYEMLAEWLGEKSMIVKITKNLQESWWPLDPPGRTCIRWCNDPALDFFHNPSLK